MPLLLLLACTTLEHTGPAGMVGRILDAEGQPMADIRVSSIEGDARTDAAGRFAVAYKAPEQHIRFTWGALAVTRTYTQADDGKQLILQLPPTRDVRLACPPEPCDVVATWALTEGFEATFRTRCREAGATVDVPGLPIASPQMSCSVGKGLERRALDLQVADSNAVLGFRPKGMQVRVTVSGSPKSCGVTVGTIEATLDGERWQAEVEGQLLVRALCDGVPAMPVTIDTAVTQDVALHWTDQVATIAAPEGSLRLIREGEDGWSIPLHRPDTGPVALPPVSPGTYRLLALPEGSVEAMLAEPPASPPGTLTWAPQTDGSSVGRLYVESPLPIGPVSVAQPTPSD